MNNCLIIMHAREIPVCLDSLGKLDIDKAYFRGFTEMQLETEMPAWMKEHPYENYIIVSDDTTPEQKALAVVEEGLTRHEIFTGWSNIGPGSKLANLCYAPLRGSIPGATSYTWTPIDMVLKNDKEFTTWFAGFSLTGARREVWEKYPFKSWHATVRVNGAYQVRGWGSDFMFSVRIQNSGYRIWTNKTAFVYHLASQENMIVGKVKPEVVLVRKGEIPQKPNTS